MKTQNYLSIFTLSLMLGIAGMGAQIAFATGGGDYCDDMECNSFFAPEVIDNPSESPMFRSQHFFYGYARDRGHARGSVDTANLFEWQSYFNYKLSQEQLKFLVYKMSLEDVRNLARTIKDTYEYPLTAEAKAIGDVLIRSFEKNRVLEVLAYLDFAKTAEPLFTRKSGYDSWDSQSIATSAFPEAQSLVKTSQARLMATADKFLQARYRFQMIRVMCYSGQYADAQKYYEENIGTFDEDSRTIKFRFMSAASGAFYKDKKYSMANYLNSLIYDRSIELKRGAFFSFHPQEEADFRETLNLAKTSHQKQVVWQMFGVYADGLTAITEIYKLDPASNLLPLLLVREVNKAEEDWSSHHNGMEAGFDSITRGNTRDDREVIGKKRLELIKAIADAKNTYRPNVWNLAVGHLLALGGDSAEAERYLQLALNDSDRSPSFRNQLRMSFLFARNRGMKTVDPAQESYLGHELKWLAKFKGSDQDQFRAETLNNWSRKFLSKLYADASDSLRSLMLWDRPKGAEYRSQSFLDSLMAFRQKASGSSLFDQMLALTYPYSNEQLQELKGINFAFDGQMAEAKDSFSQSGELGLIKMGKNPFETRMKDCFECNDKVPTPDLTRMDFVAKMVNLKLESAGANEKAAQASLELGHGYYNISHYGVNRDFSGTRYSNFPSRGKNGRVDSHAKDYSQDRAEAAYVAASKISKDKEFQAKALFQAAKAEQNRWYVQNREANGDIDLPQPRVYFQQLKNGYADTKYYQEIIGECGRFRRYIGMPF